MRARLRIFWIFIVVALALASYGGYLLATWPGFQPQSIAVDGAHAVSQREILARAAIPRERNVWLVDKRAAEARIDAIPWIAEAHIHRAFPANVTVTVRERVPFACVYPHGTPMLVDEGGRALEPCPPTGAPSLAIVVDEPGVAPGASFAGAERFTRLRSDAAALRAAGVVAARLGFDRFGGLEATLPDGLALHLGDDADLAEKAKLVGPILATYGSRAKSLRALDLRAPGTPIAVFR